MPSSELTQTLLVRRKTRAHRLHLLTGENFYRFVLVSTGVAGIAGALTIAGFKVCGWAWVVCMVVAIAVLLGGKRNPAAYPIWPWVPFFLYACARTDFVDRLQVQRLTILVTPILCGVAASALPLNDLRAIRRGSLLLMKAILAAVVVMGLAVSMGALKAKYGNPTGRAFADVGAATTLVLLSAGAMSRFRQAPVTAFVFPLMALAACVFIRTRIEVFVLACMTVVAPVFLSRRLTPKLLTWLVVLVALAYFLFYTPPVQRSLFLAGEGSLDEVYDGLVRLDSAKLKTSGRLAAWRLYLRGIDDPVLGGGGVASTYFGPKHLGQRWGHPHNEYIRLLFDYGLIGTLLLAVPIGWTLLICHRRSRTGPDSLRWLYSVGGLGLIAGLMIGITANIIMYSAFYANLLFTIIGLAFAATAQIRSAARRTNPDRPISKSPTRSLPIRMQQRLQARESRPQ